MRNTKHVNQNKQTMAKISDQLLACHAAFSLGCHDFCLAEYVIDDLK
jgi:hypothetical protein